MKYYLKEMRVHHYIKNLLVFAALACSGQLFNVQKLIPEFFAFAAFCMISSVVYIINDIHDKEKDKNHPTKKNRPIASGIIPERNAWILVSALVVLTAGCAAMTKSTTVNLLLAMYLVLNILYSLELKKIPLLDVCILVSGFLIRVLYGALIVDIHISNWLYLTVIAIAFYFALGKRRNELLRLKGKETRTVLDSYPLSFLEKNMNMCMTISNIFYALWCMDERTITHYNTDRLIFTVPIVLLITMKYSLSIEGKSSGDPVDVLIHDKVLIGLCLLYFSVMFLLLYIL